MYLYARIYVYIHISYFYKNLCMHIYINVYKFMYVCLCTSRTYLHTLMWVCMSVCESVFVCVAYFFSTPVHALHEPSLACSLRRTLSHSYSRFRSLALPCARWACVYVLNKCESIHRQQDL